MALTQEQTNIDLSFKAVAADVKAINTAVAAKADAAAITTALGNKADLTGGKLLTSQLPDLAVIDFLGQVANQAAMLALVGQKGDWCSRTDDGKVYIITGSNPAVIGSWQGLAYPAAPVLDNYSYVGAYNTAKS